VGVRARGGHLVVLHGGGHLLGDLPPPAPRASPTGAGFQTGKDKGQRSVHRRARDSTLVCFRSNALESAIRLKATMAIRVNGEHHAQIQDTGRNLRDPVFAHATQHSLILARRAASTHASAHRVRLRFCGSRKQSAHAQMTGDGGAGTSEASAKEVGFL
jgi:hypothetical protein